MVLSAAGFLGTAAGVAVSDTAEVAADTSAVASLDAGAADGLRADRLLAEADSLRLGYEFTKALGRCREAMEYAPDSLKMLEIEDCLISCENGASLLGFAYTPSVVARRRFSIGDFYLYYPLEDKGWHQVIAPGDSMDTDVFPRVVYGVEDSLEVTASDLEKVYSVVSKDGKSMYFSSTGLYGMGGYDLYVSHWDEKNMEWGTPVNLGLPFSSPYDDFLYVDSPDGKYTLFASNRGCPADSINVYVLEYDSMPIRSAAGDVEQVRRLMDLEPQDRSGEASAPEGIPENVDTKRYTDKMAEVRALKDSIYYCNQELDAARNRFAMSDDVEERARLTNEILHKEAELPKLSDSLDRAAAELQKIEMEYLFNGITIDPDMFSQTEEPKEAVEEYVFVRMTLGDAVNLVPDEPENTFDYTFMILPEGRFAPDSSLPGGIVYQIQIFSVGRKATVSQLKGLSPVFEKVTDSGRYNYSVGVFTDYRDATEALAKVKRTGFKNAYITAWNNGAPIAVSAARELQK